jgi:DNA-directed RNA polymerase specialized sigma24 family protein
VDWVYSAARRAVRDPHLAEDVTQTAFILLARKAAKLAADERAAVAPWLFTATRWTAAAALRSEARRRRREATAAGAAVVAPATSETDPWPRLEGLLEQFVGRLRDVFEAAGADEGPQVTAEGKKIVVKPAEKKKGK